jgi:hypothetical protein
VGRSQGFECLTLGVHDKWRMIEWFTNYYRRVEEKLWDMVCLDICIYILDDTCLYMNRLDIKNTSSRYPISSSVP